MSSVSMKRKSKQSSKTQATREGKRETGKESVSISKSVDTNHLTMAVSALRNNAKLTTTEEKGALQRVDTTYPPELVSAMRGLFSSKKTYDFLIHASGTVATNGAGTFSQTSANWSPAVTTFSEWSALAALFDEVKTVRSYLVITSAFGPTSSAIINQIVVAPDPMAVLPSTFTPIQRLAESEVIHCYNQPGARLKKRYAVSSDRPYALTSAPAGASGTPSGCLGAWVWSQNIVGTVSINYFFYTLECVVRLRVRA